MAPARIPHDFQDLGLRELALTHASLGSERNNERLEFLGDATLDLIVAEELFHHHPDLAEGTLTEMKAEVVSRKTLALVGRRLELGDVARVGRGMQGRVLPGSVLANLYEAVLGAIYLDGGYEAAREFALRTLREPLDRVREQRQRPSPKQELQHLCQARWTTLPEYELVERRGRAHVRAFLVAVRIGERSFPPAWGRTRKEAESWAAHEALIVLADEDAAFD